MRVILQHHPARAELLPRTAYLNPLVVADPEPAGEPNPWRTYLACLRAGAELAEPFVILQDDCIPVTGFEVAAERVRAARPGALLAFCLQGMIHHVTRSAFWRAVERGQRLLEIRPSNWVPAMALGWTPELAQQALDWDANQHTLRANYTADDGRLYYFTRQRKVPVWATVPCLVDHPDDVPSVANTGRGKRRPSRSTLLLLEGDASLLEW